MTTTTVSALAGAVVTASVGVGTTGSLAAGVVLATFFVDAGDVDSGVTV